MADAGIVALVFGLGGLDAGCGGCVCPVGHLNDVIRHAIEVAGVVLPAGAELAPNWDVEQLGEKLSGLQFGAVTFGLLRIGY